LFAAAAAAAVAACSKGGGSQAPGATPLPGNVLMIVADDVGVDMIGAYGVHPQHPPTPNLDALIDQGVLFRRCYTSPTCSPTRAAILTGRFGFRTGLGEPIKEWLPEPALALSEVTLPELLQNGTNGQVASAAFGKWHLGSAATGDIDHPNLQGFEWSEGTFGNLYFGQTYFDHSKIVNGERIPSDVYCTTEQVDDAIAHIATMPEPWFTYVAFNAAHQPFHAPPSHLHSYALSGDPESTPYEHYCAAIEAVDTEMGRLLASIDPAVLANTTIVFVGDNGSPNQAVVPPSIPGLSKGSLYEGGVRVPLVIAGKAVEQPGVCDALVASVDLFTTVAQLYSIDVAAAIGDQRPIDGIGLVDYLSDPAHPPLRSWVFASKFSPNGFGPYDSQGWMVRDQRWKLIRRTGQPDLFFDMLGLDFEGASLLPGALTAEQQAAYQQLELQLDDLLQGG
jgi:arylsulfatase A-like enzyme